MLTTRHKSYLPIYICAVIMLIITACGERQNGEENDPAPGYVKNANTPVVNDSRLLLETVKALLDDQFSSPNARITVLARTSKNEVFAIKNEKWPKDIETTYNLLKDSTGRLIAFKEIPFIKNGDHQIEVIHYFDQDGKTFAITLIDNTLNKQGTKSWARTIYYNSNFKEISRSETETNKQNTPLSSKESYKFPYATEFHPNNRFFEKGFDTMKIVSFASTQSPATEFTPKEVISYLNKSYEEVNSVITMKGYIFSDLLNNWYEFNKIKGGLRYRVTLKIKNNKVNTVSTNEIYSSYPVVVQGIREEGFNFNEGSYITLPSGKTSGLEEPPAKAIPSSTVRFDKDSAYSCFIVCSNTRGNNNHLITINYSVKLN